MTWSLKSLGKRRKKTSRTDTQRGRPKKPTNDSELLRGTREALKRPNVRRYTTKPLPERVRRRINEISKAAPFGVRGKIRKVARTAGASIGIRRRLPFGAYYAAQFDPFRDRKFKICAGRQSRKEVLFSMFKIGKGKSGPRKRKRTKNSKVRC